MKRFLSASAVGIVLSIVVAASIQAYDEPKSPSAPAASSACGKKSADCPTFGGVTPRIVIQAEEESLLGVASDSSEGACCKESSDCPVLQAAQTAKTTAKHSKKTPRAFAIELDFDIGGKSPAAADKSQCNCCEDSSSGVCATDDGASKCAGVAEKCCADVAGGSGCCVDAKTHHPACDTNKKLAHQRKLRDGEAAKVLLEILDCLGPSALEGTAFDCATCPEGLAPQHCEKALTIRQQLVEYVDNLEAQDTCASEECPHSCDTDSMVENSCGADTAAPCPANPLSPYAMPTVGPYGAPPHCYAAPPTAYYPVPYGGAVAAVMCESARHEASISALRDAAETLERTAAQLERHNLYDSSDLTREMAGHLRHESRRLQHEAVEEGNSQVETTTHHEARVHPPRVDGARREWHFGGIRVPR